MLTIRLQNPRNLLLNPEDVSLSLFDGYGRVILDQCTGQYETVADVATGLYTVRVEGAGRMIERSMRVEGDTVIDVEIPKQFSPIPVRGASSTHEYYEYPAANLTQQFDGNTTGPIGETSAAAAELVVIIRAANDRVAPDGDLGDGLLLTELDGSPLRPINLDHCHREDNGFQGFRARLAPGTYFLYYPGTPPRALTVQTFDGRQTQVFVTFWGRPILEEAGILLPEIGEGFYSEDEENRAADFAIRGLLNNRDWLPKEVMRNLLDGKFRNPMLGLLGAFVLLQRELPNWNLLATVAGNLENLIPGSNDVQVLVRILAEEWGLANSSAPAELRPEAPPMLRAAAEHAIRISWGDADYISADGILGRMAPSLYADSAWNSWQPPADWARKGLNYKALFSPGAAASWEAETSTPGDWINETVAAQARVLQARNERVDAVAIARQVGLPLSTVAALVEQNFLGR
ncbi:hypothetical protein H0Z60_14575 [Ectothiorhodospiraceae bacterium WFHF3C12]|nr:hypothetical protein [Ectothiorhodospiraceae bacterium WFHF3C12]